MLSTKRHPFCSNLNVIISDDNRAICDKTNILNVHVPSMYLLTIFHRLPFLLVILMHTEGAKFNVRNETKLLIWHYFIVTDEQVNTSSLLSVTKTGKSIIIKIFKQQKSALIEDHWCYMVSPFISVNIGSNNGLSPVRWQAITWTNADLLSIGPIETYLSDILIKIQTFL